MEILFFYPQLENDIQHLQVMKEHLAVTGQEIWIQILVLGLLILAYLRQVFLIFFFTAATAIPSAPYASQNGAFL